MDIPHQYTQNNDTFQQVKNCTEELFQSFLLQEPGNLNTNTPEAANTDGLPWLLSIS